MAKEYVSRFNSDGSVSRGTKNTGESFVDKRRRYAEDLKTKTKVNPQTGEVTPLTDKERSYRAGYLQNQTDGAIVHNLKKGKPGHGRSAIKKNGGNPPPKRSGRNSSNGNSRGLVVISNPRGGRY